MTTHEIGTQEQWLRARLELLEAEKELTRRSDELTRRRQELPWVRVEKTYRFETDKGSASMAELFSGRSQLLVYHFMFGPDYTTGCPSCSAIADGFNGFVVHLANHDVMLWAVSRAPLAKLQAYKRRMGWTFPWASSFDSDFNFDFSVSVTEEQQREGDVEYNYRRSRTASSTTPILPMRADWMASGACTSGSTGRPRGATRRASGGAATTNTKAERSRGCRGAAADCRSDDRQAARDQTCTELRRQPVGACGISGGIDEHADRRRKLHRAIVGS